MFILKKKPLFVLPIGSILTQSTHHNLRSENSTQSTSLCIVKVQSKADAIRWRLGSVRSTLPPCILGLQRKWPIPFIDVERQQRNNNLEFVGCHSLGSRGKVLMALHFGQGDISIKTSTPACISELQVGGYHSKWLFDGVITMLRWRSGWTNTIDAPCILGLQKGADTIGKFPFFFIFFLPSNSINAPCIWVCKRRADTI